MHKKKYITFLAYTVLVVAVPFLFLLIRPPSYPQFLLDNPLVFSCGLLALVNFAIWNSYQNLKESKKKESDESV